jgi:hypothetical protein
MILCFQCLRSCGDDSAHADNILQLVCNIQHHAYAPHPPPPRPQELWKLYQADKLGPRVLISDKNRLPDFEDLVRSSKFCLAPWGHGWGNRLGLYMIMGCVPVIVQVWLQGFFGGGVKEQWR